MMDCTVPTTDKPLTRRSEASYSNLKSFPRDCLGYSARSRPYVDKLVGVAVFELSDHWLVSLLARFLDGADHLAQGFVLGLAIREAGRVKDIFRFELAPPR